MRLTDKAEIETLVAAALICLRSDDVALGTTAAERTIAVVEAAPADIVSTSSVHFRVALVRGCLDVAAAGGELGTKLLRAKETLSSDENGRHVELLGVRDEMVAAVDALRRAQAILDTRRFDTRAAIYDDLLAAAKSEAPIARPRDVLLVPA